MQISDIVEESIRIHSPKDLAALIEKAAADLGFDRFAFCSLSAMPQRNSELTAEFTPWLLLFVIG